MLKAFGEFTMAKTSILAVTNQKGGVGKTTTVISLAAAFARLGKRVLIVDFDFQGNASDWLGLQQKAVDDKRTVTHAIQNNLTIPDVRIATSSEKIDLIASDISLNWEMRKLNGTSRQFQILKRILDCPEANEYEIIIVDTHPSIDPLFESVMNYAHYYLVPVFAEKHPYSGLEYLTKAIEQTKEDVNPNLYFLGLLITKYNDKNSTHKKFEAKMRELEGATKVPVLKTRIPSSEAVAGASAAQVSLLDYHPNLKIAETYMALARELMPMLKGKRIGRPQGAPIVERADPFNDFFKEASF
jgi:chromosome partitioning protein